MQSGLILYHDEVIYVVSFNKENRRDYDHFFHAYVQFRRVCLRL